MSNRKRANYTHTWEQVSQVMREAREWKYAEPSLWDLAKWAFHETSQVQIWEPAPERRCDPRRFFRLVIRNSGYDCVVCGLRKNDANAFFWRQGHIENDSDCGLPYFALSPVIALSGFATLCFFCIDAAGLFLSRTKKYGNLWQEPDALLLWLAKLVTEKTPSPMQTHLARRRLGYKRPRAVRR